MNCNKKHSTPSGIGNRSFRSATILGCLLLALTGLMLSPRTTIAQTDCSANLCDSTDQTNINGYDMFDDTNFVDVVDGLGDRRQLMPVVFAFHGAGHAMPDADEPPTATLERMTSDYDYTEETVIFLETYADLNLNP